MISSDLATLYLLPNSLIVAGVSGGPDSLALLHFLHSLHYPLLVASFNHHLRPDAEADINFVREFTASLGLSFVTGSADVNAQATRLNLSIEEAARELRYQFLFSEARKAGAQAVVVGHNADDQAETVLMHFLRGAGFSGLKGMSPRVILPIFDKHIPLVRPLLNWTRTDTLAYCREHGIEPCFDPTNTDIKYFRNRIRYELLPVLEQYNPQIKKSLVKTAQALQGDFRLLNELIDMSWQKTVTATSQEFIEFDLTELEKLTPELIRNLIRKAAFNLKPGLRDIDFDALERAATLKPIDLAGGLKTFLEGDRLYVTTNKAVLPSPSAPQISTQIQLENGYIALGNGWHLTYEEITADNLNAQAHDNSDRFTAWLDAGLTAEKLCVRTIHSGDRFEPLGMPHQTIKLAELFINLKVPQRLRRNWPLVCVGDEIAWIPGLRLAEPFKVTELTQTALKIMIYKVLGQV